MTGSEPGTRRGAHRTHRDATSALLPSVLAILAVTSLITALYVWRGEDVEPARATATTVDALRAASPSTTPSATPTTKAATAGAATGAPPSSTDTTTKAPVAAIVLNQTRRGGLARVVADRLRARGWTVAAVGNFRGTVPATTVYYPTGAQAQAHKAASSLPTPARIRPRFGNLSTTRLTVVVTDNYPS